ncbi:hypothetical protein DFJ58DRAFT_736638 [Suillus subalutaceus]|uniref:uncharacterized protein n=1 Tax=Suillus subalutaceus TaxID=48586 RepID=UPI001B88198F|nr:uncharacterized protein DFJ58DRAFT_736638 [Suillus subalutaceus]KAG1831434.1 hypothetical protein DFJ58DRAFT_736638 [Suillus subalutaceus]
MEDHPGPEHENTVVEADDGEEVVFYFGAAKTWGRGTMFMKQFESDEYAEERVSNLYFPFASKPDWEMVAFLLWLDLSMADIDEFLKLEFKTTTFILLFKRALRMHLNATIPTSMEVSNSPYGISDNEDSPMVMVFWQTGVKEK